MKEKRHKFKKLKREAEKKRKKNLKKKLQRIMEDKEHKKQLDNNRNLLEARKQQLIEKKLEKLTPSSKKQKESPQMVNGETNKKLSHGLGVKANNKRKAGINGGFQVSELPPAQKSAKTSNPSGDVEKLNSKRKGKKRKGEFAEQPVKTKKMTFQVSDISSSPGKSDSKHKTLFKVSDISSKVELPKLKNTDKNSSKPSVMAPVPDKKIKAQLNGTAGPKKNKLQETTKKAKEQTLGKPSSGQGKATLKAKMAMQNGTTPVGATEHIKAGERRDQGEKGVKQVATLKATENGNDKSTLLKKKKKAKKSAWDEPLKKGEVEVFIKSRKEIAKTKKNKSKMIRLGGPEVRM